MNIHPNEALAYAQSSHGVYFASGTFEGAFPGQDPHYEGSTPRNGARVKTYHYKIPTSLKVQAGDLVLVQVMNDTTFSIMKVTEVFDEPPATDEYDYNKPLKWVLAIVPVDESKELTQADRNALKAISRASLRSRVREINESLGFDVSQVVAKTFLSAVEEQEKVEVVEDYPPASPKGEEATGPFEDGTIQK